MSSLTPPEESPFRIIGKSSDDIRKKIAESYRSLFLGNEQNEAVRFSHGKFQYIVDIGHSDIRSEGMSYGMFIAARLGIQPLFQSLWDFSKKFLRNPDGEYAPYFAWQVGIRQNPTDFYKIDPGSAPDGEEYFAAALLVAAEKFKKPEYKCEACELLHQMAHRKSSEKLVAMFHPENFLVRFSPVKGNEFTDPSYHTLAFYRMFAKETGNSFWKKVYGESVAFLKKALHPETGLAPDYANFDGSPKRTEFSPMSENFSGDAWRVAMNLALDFHWKIPDVCEREHAEAKIFERNAIRKILRFFKTRGTNFADYRIDGSPLENSRPMTSGLIAMNAAATSALDMENAEDAELSRFFLNAFWNTPVPTGTWRYYDGMLYMLSLVALGGETALENISECVNDFPRSSDPKEVHDRGV